MVRTDKLLFRLSDGWAIGADEAQWIIYRAKKRGDQRYWQGVSFVATTKTKLERCLREDGAVVDNIGRVHLDALPDTFKEWRNMSGWPVVKGE